MATAAEDVIQLPEAACSKEEEDDDLGGAIEEITLDDQPGTSGTSVGMYPQLPRIVEARPMSPHERYEVFCNEFKIADCKPSQVLNRVHTYIEEKLINQKWVALWKGSYDHVYRHAVEILVEVDDVCGEQAHVSLFEPMVFNGPPIPASVIEAQLEELDHTLDLVELYPVNLREDDAEVKEDIELEREEARIKEIATVLDNIRFFFEHLHRDWDDEDEGEHAFDAYLRSRMQLYYDIMNDYIPTSLISRYNRTMAKYTVRRKELLDYQGRIQLENEPTNAEAVECWRKYYEVLMLSGLLQIWETLQLRAEGPCFPRVLRRTRGKRENGKTVMHLVTEELTPLMLRDFDDDTAILQHKAPLTALQQCYEGDSIILYPGVHSGEGFHELTESVTIKGMGHKKDIVVEGVAYDDLFVNVSGVTVTLDNITFVPSENSEGVLRVESGHAIVTNCSFQCDGNGITVRDGAKLTLRGCSIAGTKGPAIELMPGCTAVLENNDITYVNDLDQELESPFEGSDDLKKVKEKGAVHLHVIDPPKVQMKENRIHCEGGYGVTLGRKRYSSRDVRISLPSKVDGGDAPVSSANAKGKEVLKQLGIEMANNTIEELLVGDTN